MRDADKRASARRASLEEVEQASADWQQLYDLLVHGTWAATREPDVPVQVGVVAPERNHELESGA
jgi:hypothetical protein